MEKVIMNRKNKRGFTLVELIVVLVILAILASLLIPALTGYVTKAKKQAVITEARDVWTASQLSLIHILHNQKKVQRVATAPLLSISLPLNAAQCNPSHDIFREKQVDDHNRQDRNGDHHVHLAHIELEEVRAAQPVSYTHLDVYKRQGWRWCPLP